MEVLEKPQTSVQPFLVLYLFSSSSCNDTKTFLVYCFFIPWNLTVVKHCNRKPLCHHFEHKHITKASWIIRGIRFQQSLVYVFEARRSFSYHSYRSQLSTSRPLEDSFQLDGCIGEFESLIKMYRICVLVMATMAFLCGHQTSKYFAFFYYKVFRFSVDVRQIPFKLHIR